MSRNTGNPIINEAGGAGGSGDQTFQMLRDRLETAPIQNDTFVNLTSDMLSQYAAILNQGSVGQAPAAIWDSQTHSFNNLTPNQQWMFRKFNGSDKNSLKGLKVKFMANVAGQHFNDGVQGIIVDLPQLIYDKFIVEKTDGGLYQAFLYEFETVDLMHLSPEEAARLKDTIRNSAVKVFVDGVSAFVQKDLNSAKGGFASLENDIRYLEENLAKKKADRVILKQKIKNLDAGNAGFTLVTLNQQLKDIENHDKVEEAYLTTHGTLIVKTKLLYVIDPKTDKVTDTPLGVMMLRISYNPRETFLRATNLDYYCDDHPHPNIEGENICMGNNEAEIKRMYNAGQLYNLVDFMITFFSINPHDSGTPFMNYRDWLEERTSPGRSLSNYFREEKV